MIYDIQNNYEGSYNQGAVGTYNICNFNPLDKLIELVEENKKLYERLLASEKDKTELMKKKVTSLHKWVMAFWWSFF